MLLRIKPVLWGHNLHLCRDEHMSGKTSTDSSPTKLLSTHLKRTIVYPTKVVNCFKVNIVVFRIPFIMSPFFSTKVHFSFALLTEYFTSKNRIACKKSFVIIYITHLSSTKPQNLFIEMCPHTGKFRIDHWKCEYLAFEIWHICEHQYL